MPQRTITGPIHDGEGGTIESGEVLVAPLIPAGRASDGLVVTSRSYPIVEGKLSATVVVPGMYRIEIYNEFGKLIRLFSANIPDGSPSAVELDAIYADRLAPIDLPPAPLRRGDSILRLAPRGGRNESVLAQVNGAISWAQPAASGDMRRATYDPTRRRKNIYDRSNHTGTQSMATVEGLASAIEASSANGYSIYAIILDRKPEGDSGGVFLNGADRLRTLNHIVANNSGLADSALLATSTSAVTLLPGRRYFGWAMAASSLVSTNYLRLKSADGAIDIIGHSDNAQNAAGYNYWTRLQFRIELVEEDGAKAIQLFHRCNTSVDNGGIGMGITTKNGLELPEDYVTMVILSRAILSTDY